MKHNFKKKKLNLKTQHRKLLFINLCNSLIKYEIIKTTLTRGKFLKKYIEPIINICKYFSNFNFKFVYNKLKNINSTLKLFKIISIKYIFLNGGYINIYKLKNRRGDFSRTVLLKFK